MPDPLPIDPDMLSANDQALLSLNPDQSPQVAPAPDSINQESTEEQITNMINMEFGKISDAYKNVPESSEELSKSLNADIESLCRHALTVKADNIIVLDRSGRPYGSFIHNYLPIIRLEYCKQFGIPPSEVELPKILFLNPDRGKINDGTIPNSGQISGKMNVIFEEASRSADFLPDWNDKKWYSRDIQYKMFSRHHDPSDQNEPYEISGWWRRTELQRRGEKSSMDKTSVGALIVELHKVIPDATFEYHIGQDDMPGGNLQHAHLTRPYVEDNQDPMKLNIAEPIPDRIGDIRDIYALAKIYAKRELKIIGEELGLGGDPSVKQ